MIPRLDSYVQRAETSRYRRLMLHGMADATVAAVLVASPGIALPTWFAPAPARVQRTESADGLLRRIDRQAALSDRAIGNALGVSHPTVANIRLGGRLHRPETVERLEVLAELVSRTTSLVGGPPTDIREVLMSRRGTERSALELLGDGESLASAYLAVLKSTRKPTAALRRSAHTRNASEATVALET